MTKKVFKTFDKIQKKFNEEVIEIAITRHQADIAFNSKIVNLSGIKDFYGDMTDDAFISCDENDLIHLFCRIPEDEAEAGIFKTFVHIMDEIFDKVCSCPVLEFVVSERYIKLYLDKQGLTIEDLLKYEQIFEDNNTTLELHGQRPYLLFINLDAVEV